MAGPTIEKVDLDNQELQQALQIVQFTHNSLFLTGKAGTGKSTFLRYIAATTKKKHVVLAPTGIAAINAGGATLHSFFKLPFHPLLPTDTRYTARNIRKTLRYNGEKIKLLREVELIIIDEVSMVRADIIDFIDKVLRIYCHKMREPFGGKQMLFVGDIYQLEPVLKEEDRQLLEPFYKGAYFFNAHIFRAFPLVSIELRKVYRQTDPHFISILDHIRTNRVIPADLAALNARVSQRSQPADAPSGSLSITLSTMRDNADWINSEELSKLPGDNIELVGEINGEFPESSLPTPLILQLKVGAQVMFVKNNADHLWVNGTLGVVTGIDEEAGLLYVQTETADQLQVERELWENVRYHFDETEKKIVEEQIGTYIQYPLKLAWAITIHKSQGLTFQRADIDLGHGAFAGGQTYVALSRCTSLEGIRLHAPVRRSDIFVKDEVLGFARNYNDAGLIGRVLRQSKADKEYYDAARAWEEGDYGRFIDQFFLAIHSRYDIEKPASKRLFRMKLNHFNALREENERLKETLAAREKFLEKLATEYFVMGKECESEGLTAAAIKNYRKALELRPDYAKAQRRIKKLEKEGK